MFALRADGLASRCSARRDRGVEEQRVDRLVALEVDDAEDVAGRELVRPPLPRRQRDVDGGARRIERRSSSSEGVIATLLASLHGRRPRSARSRARSRGATAGTDRRRPPARPRLIVSSTGGGSYLRRRIERVRRVRQHDQRVHLGAQLDGGARAAVARHPRQRAVVVRRRRARRSSRWRRRPACRGRACPARRAGCRARCGGTRCAASGSARRRTAPAPPPRRRIPEIVSCQPHVSATIEHSTRPMSEYSTRPAVRNAVNCALSVSAML